MTDADSKGPSTSGSARVFSKQHAPLHLLGRTETPEAKSLLAAARDLLSREFGGDATAAWSEGFAYGGVGLLAQHTSYYDGFAVVLGMSQLVAVVVRPAAGAMQVTLDHWYPGEAQVESRQVVKAPTRKGPDGWDKVLAKVLEEFSSPDTFWDVAIVSSIPAGCYEAFLSALTVATTKAVCAAQQKQVPTDMVATVRAIIQDAIDAEFSKAFLMVAQQAAPNTLCIIDTLTEELIPFEGPASDNLSWALVEAEQVTPRSMDFYHACGVAGQEALVLLKNTPFAGYGSFRDVDHLDLPRVLAALPVKYRAIVRHLVNENKRVQSMIGAIRGDDWQKLGGLLFISHSSLSNEWQGTNDAIDGVVAIAEQMSAEGVYGACMTGRGGYVLLVGRPFAITRFVGQIEKQLQERFQRKPRIIIL
ncbi:MAG: hypothetical protein AAF564_22885 [Bacteroidota bacterium]